MPRFYTLKERGFIATEFCKHGSYKKAKEEYAKEFPDRPIPCNKTILRLYRKLRFNACAENKQYIRKAPVTGNETIIKKTLKVIKENPDWSIRRMSKEIGISTRSCSTILQKCGVRLNHNKFSKYKKIDEQLRKNNKNKNNSKP